jgi:hypothetical protein
MKVAEQPKSPKHKPNCSFWKEMGEDGEARVVMFCALTSCVRILPQHTLHQAKRCDTTQAAGCCSTGTRDGEKKNAPIPILRAKESL